MDWKFLFTSFEGRIGRQQFWIGALVTCVVGIVPTVGLDAILSNTLLIGIPDNSPTPEQLAFAERLIWIKELALFILFTYPFLALSIKRRHDRGSSGLDVYILVGMFALTLIAPVFVGSGNAETLESSYFSSPFYLLLNFAILLFGFYIFTTLYLLKGDEGSNVYGPDPLG